MWLLYLISATVSGTISLSNEPADSFGYIVTLTNAITYVDTTDSSGAYSVVVDADTYDIVISFYQSGVYYPETHSSVIISGDTTIDDELTYIPPVRPSLPKKVWYFSTTQPQGNVDIKENLRVVGKTRTDSSWIVYLNMLYGYIENLKKASGDTSNFLIYQNLPDTIVFSWNADSLCGKDSSYYLVDSLAWATKDTLGIWQGSFCRGKAKITDILLGEAKTTSVNYKSFWR